MVAESNQSDHGQMLLTSENNKSTEVDAQTKSETSTNKNALGGFWFFRSALRKQGISRIAEDLILKSWRTSTQKQYNTYINRWLHFCGGKTNPFKTTAQTVTEFLVSQYKIHRYDMNDKLCIVTTVKEYMTCTKHLRTGTKLLISTVKPHNSVGKQTISRWIKLIMSKAGIPDIFKPHSTRAASVSQAYCKGVPLKEIIGSAGWNNAKTFAKY